MPRPTSRKKNPVSRAVTELREKLGESQQAFAARLNVSVTTVAKYETSNPPSGYALVRLWDLAERNGAHEAAEILQQQYLEELKERDGILGKFAVQGAVRYSLVGQLEALRKTVEKFRDFVPTNDEAADALIRIHQRMDWGQVFALRDIFENLDLIQQQTRLPIKVQGALDRFHTVTKATKEIEESLNMISLYGKHKTTETSS